MNLQQLTASTEKKKQFLTTAVNYIYLFKYVFFFYLITAQTEL